MKPIPLLLLAALLLAAFLRLYQLGSLPVSLFGDEIDVGYQALSLWQTGKSYTGQVLPTYIQSVAESRAPLLMYTVAPFVGYLGSTNLAVRLAPAIFGILGILAIYWLAQTLADKEKHRISVAGLAALLLAVSFWHIQYSRAAFESSLLLLLLMVGLGGLVGYLLTKKRAYAWLWPLLALAFYTYSTATLFVPALIVLTLLIFRSKVKFDAQIIVPLTVTLVLLLPIAWQIVGGKASDRFRSISIFGDRTVTDAVVLSRIQPWVNPQLDRLFHNRPLELATRFSQNYLAAFSPNFLFSSGDSQLRHSVPGFGELPLVFAPLILLGLYKAARRSSIADHFLLSWLFLAPISSALTIDGGNHATRLILLLPPLVLLAATGAGSIFEFFKGRWALLLTALWVGVLAWQVTAYWYQYTNIYRYQSARSWHYGYQEVMREIPKYDTGKNRIFINNTHEPSLLRFAFYTNLPPRQFQAEFGGDKIIDNIVPGFNGFSLGERYYFGRAQTLESLQTLLAPGDLYLVIQGEEVPGDWDWTKNPPETIKVLASTKDIWGLSYMYLVTGK